MTSGKIVLLYDSAALHTGTVADHIAAFERLSKNRIYCLDARGASAVGTQFSMADAIVLHYSLVISSQAHITSTLASAIAGFKGLKILFIQDEYRWIDRTSDAISYLGISVVYTVANLDVIRKIYRDPRLSGLRFEQTLTGFVPTDLCRRDVPKYPDRQIDVSYRARRVPAWLGALGQDKWQIGRRFAADCRDWGLNCDIEMSESSRIYGEEWIRFVENSKAVLGTESGASFMDFNGKVQPLVEEFERRNPEEPFEVIREKFLEGRDGEIVINVISPRCFEAAALRTLMILYPGDYSGVLEPYRHYIPLMRDHSNMAEVVAVLRDHGRAQKIIDDAYREVACSNRWTYESFIGRFDALVDEEWKRLQWLGAPEEGESYFSNQKHLVERFAIRRARKSKWAIRINGGLSLLEASMYRRLPKPVAHAIIRTGKVVTSRLRPLVRRMLLGH